MARYELSKAADQDFENIFEFGIDTFGLTQAMDYQQGMEKRFTELVEQPKHYTPVNHIRKGYHRSVYSAHSIYYKIETDRVFIVRILGQQDINKAFK